MALPLVAFAVLAGLFWFRLGSGDPARIPSALIGRPAPLTKLPALDGLVAGRHAGTGPRPGRIQRSGQRRQRLGIVVCAVSRRSATAGATRAGQAHSADRHQLQGQPGQRPALSRALRQSVQCSWCRCQRPRLDRVGSFTACRKHSSSARDGTIAYKLIGPITPQNFDVILKAEIERALRGKP